MGFTTLVVYPMAFSAVDSFRHDDGLSKPHWVGLRNYHYMFKVDPIFWTAVRNTMWLIVIGVPITIIASIATACLLAPRRRGMRAYRTIVYLPSIVPPVAAALAFAFLLDPGTGPVNRFLGALHLPQPLWFHDPRFAKPGLVLLGLWGIGPTMLLLLTGMVRVPSELYELATIEGAGPWQRFRFVTLPAISPVLLFTVVISTIGALQYFTPAYVAARAANTGTASVGTPLNSTMFYGVWLYRKAFTDFDLGYASAMAWVLFLASLGFLAAMLRLSRRWIHAAGGPA
jgi:multiple sugar transport system permease protein